MKTVCAVVAAFVCLAFVQTVDVTGEWEMAIVAKGTLRIKLVVAKEADGLSATLVAPNGEKRPAEIMVEGTSVTIRFELDNPGEPVRVVLTGTVDGDRMKGKAEFVAEATADWTATRTKAA